jgi:hypothetical protein
MERPNRKRDNKSDEGRGSDEVDRAESYPRAAPRKSVKPIFYHESSPGPSGLDRLESPGQDDSAYYTFPHHASSTSRSFSKSSSLASSDRFPSEENFRSSSPFSNASTSSKKVHSTLIRIQLGDDKKVSHEWYSEFTNQSHQHKQAFSSPLANRAANTSSQFEYDSHIAQMRGNFSTLYKTASVV